MNSTIAINGENDTAIETNQIPEVRINNLEALFQLFVDDCASPSESLPSLYQIIALTACILLFYNARRLVNNMVAFYAAGSLLGVFGSLLLIAYLVQKLMPRRTFFPVYIAGWPLSAYIYYYLWTNMRLVLVEYYAYVFAYFSFFLLTTLTLCYRFGPPSDIRSLNLIQWFMQFCALLGIYISLQHTTQTVMVFILLALTIVWHKIVYVKNMSRNFFQQLRFFFRGPEPRKLLTEQEYIEEAESYTQKELGNLRSFCLNSPSSTSLRLISKLHDSSRMASFISGESKHVSMSEAWEHTQAYEVDDSENELDSDSENNNEKIEEYKEFRSPGIDHQQQYKKYGFITSPHSSRRSLIEIESQEQEPTSPAYLSSTSFEGGERTRRRSSRQISKDENLRSGKPSRDRHTTVSTYNLRKSR